MCYSIYFQSKIQFSECIWWVWLLSIFILMPFYFPKKPHYFSAFERKFAKFSMSFRKHKSVFLQILYQYSVPSNITPLYFFRLNIMYVGQKQPMKVQFLTFSSARFTIRKF